MTTSLLALFEEARAGLEPSASQIAIGRARLKAAVAAPGSGVSVALGAAGLAGIGVVAIAIAFSSARAEVVPVAPPPLPAPPPAAVVAVVEPPAPAPAAAVVVPAPAPRPPRARAVAKPEADSLPAELRLIRAARTALAAAAFDDAHAALSEHARAFPEAQLAEEAALLDIELSCAEGDVSGARTAILHFAERWPRSSKRARAERACHTEETTDAP